MVATCERNRESEEHTIVCRGIEYGNVRYAVCLHERSEYKQMGVQLYNSTVKKRVTGAHIMIAEHMPIRKIDLLFTDILVKE